MNYKSQHHHIMYCRPQRQIAARLQNQHDSTHQKIMQRTGTLWNKHFSRGRLDSNSLTWNSYFTILLYDCRSNKQKKPVISDTQTVTVQVHHFNRSSELRVDVEQIGSLSGIYNIIKYSKTVGWSKKKLGKFRDYVPSLLYILCRRNFVKIGHLTKFQGMQSRLPDVVGVATNRYTATVRYVFSHHQVGDHRKRGCRPVGIHS